MNYETQDYDSILAAIRDPSPDPPALKLEPQEPLFLDGLISESLSPGATSWADLGLGLFGAALREDSRCAADDSGRASSPSGSDSSSERSDVGYDSYEAQTALGASAAPMTSSHTGQKMRHQKEGLDRKVNPRRFDLLLKTVTAAETELLAEAGVVVPQTLPVPKETEKKVRAALRRIRNKASAQRSRGNKESRILALETENHVLTNRNGGLTAKVSRLEQANATLQQQLDDLRAMVAAGLGHTRGGGTLCMMTLCLGMATLAGAPGTADVHDFAPEGRRARTLLQGFGREYGEAGPEYGRSIGGDEDSQVGLIAAQIVVMLACLLLGLLWGPAQPRECHPGANRAACIDASNSDFEKSTECEGWHRTIWSEMTVSDSAWGVA